jgi:hypothetical protein
MSFFTSFVAAFAMASLIPVVRQNLDLTKADLGASGKGLEHSAGLQNLVCKNKHYKLFELLYPVCEALSA